jgi:hypothetical protein
MKYFLTIFFVALLSSCVSLPIPPTGKDQGKLGALKLSISYVPYAKPDSKSDANIVYSWQNFSKTIKDK